MKKRMTNDLPHTLLHRCWRKKGEKIVGSGFAWHPAVQEPVQGQSFRFLGIHLKKSMDPHELYLMVM
jgi:hypothetical protein